MTMLNIYLARIKDYTRGFRFNRLSPWIFSFFLIISLANNVQAQLSVTTEGSPFTIDFDNTVSGVNNGQFDGTGFAPSPASGQINSDAFSINGLSDGDLDFGDTGTFGDYARGTSTGDETTGGIYAFEVASGDYALGFQSSGADFTPGEIILKITNNTGSDATSIKVSYKIRELNNSTGTRSSEVNFSYSGDGVSFTDISSLDFNSGGTQDFAPIEWKQDDKAYIIDISGSPLGDGEDFYIKWITDDFSGTTGDRDELSIDDIAVIFNPIPDNDSEAVVYAPFQEPAGTISSLSDNPLNSRIVFYFVISDKGTIDGNPTNVQTIRFVPNTTNVSWASQIQGITIASSTYSYVQQSVDITDAYIDVTFAEGELTVADGDDLALRLEVYLNETGIIDGGNLDFKISSTSHGFLAYSSGSSFATTFPADINSNQFTIDVEAMELGFVQQPILSGTNIPMAADVSVEAVDENGNRDLDFTDNIALSSSGTMTDDPILVAAIAGIATWAEAVDPIVHTIIGQGLNLTASSGVLTGGISDIFDVEYSADRVDFTGQPLQGQENKVISTILVSALKPDLTVDATFSGNVTLIKSSGPGNVLGTLTKAAVDGVAVFDDVVLDAKGSYVLEASAEAYMTNDTSDPIEIGSYFEDFSICPPVGWLPVEISGNSWLCSSDYASVSGIGGGIATQAWYIGPVMDLSTLTDPILLFDSWTGGTDSSHPKLELMYSTDYPGTGNPNVFTWMPLTFSVPGENSQTWVPSGSIDLSGIVGTSVYIAFKYTSSGTTTGSATEWRIDNVSIGENGCVAPITQPSNLAFTGISQDEMTLIWDNGNGTGRIVIAHEGSTVTETPADATDYMANAVYGTSGTDIGSSFIVYKGNGNSVTVSGLTENTEYYFSVFEYNCDAADPTFNTTSPLTGSQNTINPLASDIITETSYLYNTNIDNVPYSGFNNLNVGNTIDMFKMAIRDEGFVDVGGVSDGNGTELTSITFSTNGSTSIKGAAIFVGALRIAEKAVNGTTSFTLDNFENTLIAPSDDSIHFTLRVTFNDGFQVRDNEQVVFTVTNAVANIFTSPFALPDAGGAQSIDSGGDENKIRVVATELAFVAHPDYSIPINEEVDIRVEAIDSRGSRDRDKTLTISNISGTGTLSSASGLSRVTSAGSGYAFWLDLVYDTEEETEFEITDSEAMPLTISSGILKAKQRFSIFSFDGATGDEESVEPDYQPAHLTITDISRGSNVDPSIFSGGFGARSWSAVQDTGSYYQISIVPDPGYSFSITNLELDNRRTNTGPNFWKVTSSLDNYSTTIGTLQENTTPGAWVRNADVEFGTSIENVDETVILRVFAYGASHDNGTWAVDNIELFGSLVDVGIPSFNATYPQYDSVSVAGFDLMVNSDEAATAYYIVQTPGTSAPSVVQILAGENGDGIAAEANGAVNITEADSTFSTRLSTLGLASLYDVYFVLDDGTNQSNAVLLENVPLSDSDTELTSAIQPVTTSISSLVNDVSTSTDVFSFNVSDLGTADGASSNITKLHIVAGANNTVADWQTAIGGIAVYNNTSMDFVPISMTTIGAASIDLDFVIGDFAIADGSLEQITLSVWLTNTVTDNEILEFEIGGVAHGNETSNIGSQFNSTLTTLTSNSISIEVDADSLYFADVPVSVIDNFEIFSVEVQAVDQNGNLDLDETSTAVLSRGVGSGTLSSATSLTQAMTSGVATWMDLQYDGPPSGEIFTLVASDNSSILSQTISNTIQFGSGNDLTVTAGNSVVITSKQNFGNVTIEDGGTLKLALGDTLEITGDFSIDGTNSVFEDQGGTTSFIGTIGQSIQSDETDKTVEFFNIDVSNTSAAITNEIHISLINTLKLNTNTTFDVDGSSDDRNFTLVSSPTATARIGAVEDGAALNGNVVWQRSLRTGPEGWRYVGTPIKGQTVAEWIDDVYIQGIEGQLNSWRNTNFATYNEALGTTGQNGLDGWEKYNLTTDPIEVGVGNKLWEWNQFYNPTLTIVNKGLPTIGDGGNDAISGTETIAFPVSFEPTSTDGGGWNFFANPYPSELDWNSADFVHTGVEGGAVYIWNPDLQQYGTYDGSESINGVSQYIASGQGFFVKATSGAAVISVNEQAKASDDGNSFLRIADEKYASIKLKISSNKNHSDETVVAFKEYTKDGYDPEHDARKLAGGYVNFSSKLDNNLLMAINSMGTLRGVKRIKLNIDPVDVGGYSITFPKIKDVDTGTIIHLIDNYLDKSIVVNPSATYNFSIDQNIAETYGSERFELQLLSPVKFSIDEVRAKSGQEFVVPVYADQLSDILSSRLALRWDIDALSFVGIEETGNAEIQDFDLSDVENGHLLFNGTEDTPLDYPDETKIFSIRFKAMNGQSQTQLRFEKQRMNITAINDIEMPFSTKDAIIEILQNRMVAGKVATYNGEPVNNVSIEAEGDDLLTQFTDELGAYSLDAFEQSNYIISGSKTDEGSAQDAVTVLDIIKTRRHLLQLDPFESPYQSVAADVNASKSITALDLAQIRKVVLGVNEGFEGGLNWLFIPRGEDLSNDPFDFNTNLDVVVADENMNLDFVAVKVGDVDNSWNMSSSGRKSVSRIDLEFDRATLAEDIIEVPVTVADFQDISGYQFSISWDAKQFEFHGVEHHSIEGYFNEQFVENGVLSTIWDDSHGKSMDLADGSTLFTLKFIAKKKDADGEVSLNSAVTKALAFDGSLGSMQINTATAKINLEELRNGTMELYQNIPNPFDISTSIGFKISHPGLARLSVINMLGETVYVHEQNYNPGVYQIDWNKKQSKKAMPSGVYLYKLESNGNEVVRKMLIK